MNSFLNRLSALPLPQQAQLSAFSLFLTTGLLALFSAPALTGLKRFSKGGLKGLYSYTHIRIHSYTHT
jgi:hypothetical protein